MLELHITELKETLMLHDLPDYHCKNLMLIYLSSSTTLTLLLLSTVICKLKVQFMRYIISYQIISDIGFSLHYSGTFFCAETLDTSRKSASEWLSQICKTPHAEAQKHPHWPTSYTARLLPLLKKWEILSKTDKLPYSFTTTHERQSAKTEVYES